MISVEEIPKEGAQAFFPIEDPQTARLRPKAQVVAADLAPPLRRYELNLSVAQLLAAFTSVFGAVGLLLWAFIRLWLFEQ